MKSSQRQQIEEWYANSQEFQAGAILAYLNVLDILKTMDPNRESGLLSGLGTQVSRLALQVRKP